MRRSKRERVDAGCVFDGTQRLDEVLRQRVIGQDESLQALVCSYSRLFSGLRDPSRPVLTALLLGPTGVGKTETARALAHTLFGSERSLTRVNAEEYAHGHEMSKLLGAPPGYLGHQVEPILSQSNIDRPHRQFLERRAMNLRRQEEFGIPEMNLEDGKHVSIILFDEIEKAHPTLWNALLGILEDGELTLGDNSTTDFTHSIILMTSNVGSLDMSQMIERKPLGFRRGDEEDLSQNASSVQETAIAAAEMVFPFEFLNRFDEILAYSPLDSADLERVFDKFLNDIHERAISQAGVPLIIKVSSPAKSLIIERGSDLRFGARPLRRAMEREIVDPLSRLIALRRLHAGDVVEVDREEEKLIFYRSARDTHLVTT